MKALKYSLIGLGLLVALAVAGAAIFAMSFDPNRYRGDIERLAKERTGRTLKLQGPLQIAFFPSLGAKVAGVTLSEHGSEREFLALESAHGAVAVMPLLHGEVVVDRISVAGLKANVVKGKDGRYNFSDLLEAHRNAPAKAEGPVKFDVAGVNVDRSSVTYRDAASGRELTLSDIKLATGRIAEKADGKLEFAATAKGKNPALDAKIDLSGEYKVDLAAKSFAFSKVDAAAKGTLDKDSIDGKLTAPRVEITADKASGDAVSAQFELKGPQRSTTVSLKLGGVQGSAKALVIPAISGEVAMTGPDLPNKAIKVPLNGKARADLEKETASAELTSKFDESNIQAKLGLAKFSPPSYLFDISVDRLNVDKYFPPKPQAQKKEASSDTPIDLSALKGLAASGRVQFGALQVHRLKLANFKADIKVANGRADVSPHSANLYDGTINGALSANANSNQIAIRETLANVTIGQLLKDLAERDALEGRGNFSLDVTGSGASVNAIKRALNGNAKLNLRDGAIKGINAGEILQKVRSLGQKTSESADQSKKTDFSELSATFVIRNGVAHNEDLDLKSPFVRLGGAGDIDVGNSSLNYIARASVVASAKGQGGADLSQLAGVTVPVKLTGAFDAVKYEVDYAAVAAEVAKSKIGQKLGERLGLPSSGAPAQGSGGGSPVDKIRGLFGR